MIKVEFQTDLDPRIARVDPDGSWTVLEGINSKQFEYTLNHLFGIDWVPPSGGYYPHAEVPRAQAAMELFETGTIIEQKLAESVPGTVC